ncbi:MAG: hypothetical protein NUV74_10025 [Candidatus Brocadiaceae bacterium]|nr:hypothetical protein [Candidatus Brocadiaceae bacterium]
MARKFIEANILKDREAQIDLLETTIRESLAKKKDDISKVETLTKQVYESEVKRGEYLEGKAQVFLAALGLSLVIVAALPVLFDSKTWTIPSTITLFVGLLYSLTLIHFFVAVYYSVNARQSYGLALPNVDDLMENIQADKVETIDRILNDITKAKYNEPILLQKSNFLAVAETMFRRGLLFIATASILVVITKLLVETNLL